jgi:hypothetical protein
MIMPKKKIKTKVILLKLTEEDYQKVVLQAGDYKTLTRVIEEDINGGYYSKFKTNDLPDMSIKQNREVVKQIQKQNNEVISQNELEDAKAAFIARRNARKEGVSND